MAAYRFNGYELAVDLDMEERVLLENMRDIHRSESAVRNSEFFPIISRRRAAVREDFIWMFDECFDCLTRGMTGDDTPRQTEDLRNLIRGFVTRQLQVLTEGCKRLVWLQLRACVTRLSPILGIPEAWVQTVRNSSANDVETIYCEFLKYDLSHVHRLFVEQRL